MRVRIITLVVVFAVALAIPQVRFWQEDRCLDAGGRWTSRGCEGVRFEPAISRQLLAVISIVSLSVSVAAVAAGRRILWNVRRLNDTH